MFITDQQLSGFLQDVRQTSTVLEPFWDSIVTAANQKAYWTIITALQNRGWRYNTTGGEPNIIDQWDRGAEFQRSIAIWYAIQEIATMAPDAYSKVALKEIDRRPELKTVNLTINGIWQDPTEIYGQPQTGPADLRLSCNPGRIEETEQSFLIA